MALYVPDYYARFHCIADRCKHSCCIGWEIDIDPGTLETYRTLPGDVGEALRRSIVETEEGAHFRLTEDERCPMLMENGLCRLICAHGEESLCQICADHPRFRNFLADRTEMGLGLCCEAAAALILNREEPVKLVCLQDDGGAEEPDEAFLLFRDRLIAMAQDRTRPMAQRVEDILHACGAELPVDYAAWADFLMTLERLDEAWVPVLERLREKKPSADDRWEIPLEQLMCYLLFRHLAGALEDGDVQGRVAFCGVMWKLLRRMNRGDLTETARLFSSEIEYSDENTDAVLEKIDSLLFT